MEIKFCENNFSNGTEEVVDKLKQNYKNIDINVESCLGYCGECASSPYALVDDELILADSPDKLYNDIVKLISEKS